MGLLFIFRTRQIPPALVLSDFTQRRLTWSQLFSVIYCRFTVIIFLIMRFFCFQWCPYFPSESHSLFLFLVLPAPFVFYQFPVLFLLSHLLTFHLVPFNFLFFFFVLLCIILCRFFYRLLPGPSPHFISSYLLFILIVSPFLSNILPTHSSD